MALSLFRIYRRSSLNEADDYNRERGLKGYPWIEDGFVQQFQSKLKSDTMLTTASLLASLLE